MRLGRPGRLGSERKASALGAAAVALLLAVPLFSLLLGSFGLAGRVPPDGKGWLGPYTAALSLSPLLTGLINSASMAAAFVPLSVFTASMAGFAISQVSRVVRTIMVAGLVMLLSIPATALWIPRFLIYEKLGAIDTPWPLLAGALLGGSPFYVLIYAYSYSRVPREIVHAARLEGASTLSIWWRVCQPLVRPTTAAVAALAFVLSWANFVDPLLYLQSESRYTSPLVLRYLEQLGPTDIRTLLAAAVLTTVPVVIAFFCVHHLFYRDGGSPA